MKTTFFSEDMNPGQKLVGPSIVVDKLEMVEFATIWDPLPVHIDEEAGNAAFGGLTAPGIYVLALKQRLIHRMPERYAVIASFGYDEIRFHEPVRPGDTLTLVLEWIERRESKSNRDRGIVTVRFSLTNQTGTTGMSHLDTILVSRRGFSDNTAT